MKKAVAVTYACLLLLSVFRVSASSNYLLRGASDNLAQRKDHRKSANHLAVDGDEAGKKCEERIAGGHKATRDRFPYICSLKRRGTNEYACGGTLIRSQWVLTAAHCLYSTDDTGLGHFAEVQCGDLEIESKVRKHTFHSKQAYWPDEWTGDARDGFDVGLIRLDREALFVHPRFEEIGANLELGDLLVSAGLGATGSERTSKELRVADRLPYLNSTTCEFELEWETKDHMICAGMRAWTLVGVVPEVLSYWPTDRMETFHVESQIRIC